MAREALRGWFRTSGASQAALAEALGVTQQTISSLLKDRAPSEELSKVIEAATGISWKGWFTAEEMEARATRIARARELRASLRRSGRPRLSP